MLWHLGCEKIAWTSGRLHVTLWSIGRVGAEIRKKAIRTVDGGGDFRCHRLVEGDRTSMALDRGVFALALHLLSFDLFSLALFTLSMGHFFLALPLKDFPFPRVPFTFAVQGLWGGVLHGLANTGK